MIEITTEELLAADQILAGTNQMRRDLTAIVREADGRVGPLPEVGERLVCRRNDDAKGLMNGGIFRVMEVLDHPDGDAGASLIKLRIQSEDDPAADPLDVSVHTACFTWDRDSTDYAQLKRGRYFEHARVLTAHLAQGSQWPHVVVFDESASFRADAQRWLYTAITRASERVTIGMA